MKTQGNVSLHHALLLRDGMRVKREHHRPKAEKDHPPLSIIEYDTGKVWMYCNRYEAWPLRVKFDAAIRALDSMSRIEWLRFAFQ